MYFIYVLQSDDAALQLAIQASMGTGTTTAASNNTPLSQEQEDFLLAQAIAESEREARSQGRTAGTSRNQNQRNCQLS